MNILLYVNDDIGLHNSIVRYMDYMASILNANGYRTLAVGYSDKPTTFTTTASVVPGNGTWQKVLTAGRLLRFAARPSYEVVLVTQLAAPLNPFVVVLLRLLGKRVIYVCMDPPPEIYPLIFERKFYGRLFVRYLVFSESIIDRCVDVTFTIGKGVERLLRERNWRGRVRLFFNVHGTELDRGGDVSESQIRLDPTWRDATIMLYMGAIQERIRGIEEQLEALALARESNANVKMVLIGKVYDEEIRNKVVRLGIADHVRIMDAVHHKDLGSIIAECDVAVFRSVSYSLPSKVFEYVAHGLPVIAAAGHTDVNELLGQFVELYDGTVQDLARAIVRSRGKREKSRHHEAATAFMSELRRQSASALLEEIELVKKSKRRAKAPRAWKSRPLRRDQR